MKRRKKMKRPLRYRGLSDTWIGRLQPVSGFLRSVAYVVGRWFTHRP
jgi:hypothetical protein